METQLEACPWCHGEVRVKTDHRRLYTCTLCKKSFTFAPSAGQAKGKASAPLSEAGVVPPSDFVETPFVKDLVDRMRAYLQDGLHVHLSGPAGGGKTTLALHMAQQLGRPVVLIHGDDQIGTADLVGKESGYKRSYTRDQFIHTVLKVDEEAKPLWVGRALTEACEKGCTVVYDEFTRSRPEANNVLLSVLEERVLPLRGENMPIHPEFRIIFTSNPADYAGVHGAQDALLDRMVTIRMGGFDQDTETAITQARSGLPPEEVGRIIVLVRAFRGAGLKTSSASVRPAILISRILRVRGGHACAEDPVFVQTCRDVLLSQARRTGTSPQEDRQNEETLLRLIVENCSVPLPMECTAVEPGMDGVEPDDLMAELGKDQEVRELLLRKIREKRLAGKLLTEVLKS
jgi:nitric oxide reductase NorQ protein